MRLTLLVAWTLLCSLLLLGPLLARLAGRVPAMRLGARVCHLWARGLLRILGVRVQTEGPRPPRGAFLVSNHTSWLDILVLAAWQPSNFIAKKEVAQLPGIGPLAATAGTLFLDRESRRDAHRLAGELRGLLAGGLELTLFPEGYCADGHRMLPFRPALFGAAAELQTPCVPIAIHYDLPAVVWNDGSGIGAHARRLLRLRRQDRGRQPIRAFIRAGEAKRGSDRKLLARVLEEEVRKRYVAYAPAPPAAPADAPDAPR